MSSSADSATAQPSARMAPAPDPRPTAPASDEAPAAPRRSIWDAGWAKFSDNAIPSLVLGLFAGLMLFHFNETSSRVTRLEDRVTRLEHSIDARFTRLENEINARFDAVDARFTSLEENQHEIALTLARLVALVEARKEATFVPPG